MLRITVYGACAVILFSSKVDGVDVGQTDERIGRWPAPTWGGPRTSARTSN